MAGPVDPGGANLAGEKVDVIAYTPSGPVPIWLRRRVSGNDFAGGWSLLSGCTPSPSLPPSPARAAGRDGWRAGLRLKVSSAWRLPSGFRILVALPLPSGRGRDPCDEYYRELAVRRGRCSARSGAGAVAAALSTRRS